MRKVKVFEWLQNKETKIYERMETGTAKFHQFGCDWEELNDGVGTFSTAIVEYENGEVGNIAVENIQFIDED